MSDPAVSVVIACFNYAHTLPDAVGSILAQTLDDFELTIVDDGSTDDSLAVARSLATDPRVTVIAQENSGQPAIPRNRAIERARGRFVVSLDADDRLGPTALQVCAATLDADDRAGLAYPQQQDFGFSDQLHQHLDWSLDRLKRFNHLPSATMFRRAGWEAAGGYSTNVRGYEDWDLWLGIAEAGYTGRPARGALWHYRKHGGGVYAEAKGGDQRLKANVVVNRAGLYGDGVVAWARGVLAGDPAALATPGNVGVVPDVPDPPRPLRVARDGSERADWYVDSDDLEGPWPERPLADALELVDRLGYTRVHAGGAEVARKRGTDARVSPIPFFRAGASDGERARALALAVEDLAVVHALRGDTSLDAGRTAMHLGVAPADVAELVSEAQALMRSGGPVPLARAGALGRLASVLRRDRALAGDVGGASRAAALERAAARAGLEDARRIAILAFADELIADPALLRAYGSAVSATDDATLVIVTDDADRLVAAVAAADLDGDASPDLLAMEAQPAGVDAVFSRREHGGGLPRFDDASLDGLRALLDA
jgi:hypothetical protein